MKKIFFLTATAILAAVTAAVILNPTPTVSPAPSPVTPSSTATSSLDQTCGYSDCQINDGRDRVTNWGHAPGRPILTGTPGQVWISAGPGDGVCHAPGDCGYGDTDNGDH